MKTLTHEEWLEWRRGRICGSDAPAIMNESPWSTPEFVWKIKTGRCEEQPATWPMRRGKWLEPVARREYEKRTGVAMPPVCLELPDDPFGMSFDGVNDDAPLSIEIKAPKRADHELALRGQIPRHYVWQCVQGPLVCGHARLDYVSYHPSFEKPYDLVVVPFYRVPRLENELVRAGREFWRHVLRGTKPRRAQVFLGGKNDR